jgi:large subunit ribosomal protein L44e
MKVPKKVRIYCPKCNAYTEHTVSVYKSGKVRVKMSEGWRRYHRKKAGYGSQPKPIAHKQSKVNKKTRPHFKCATCSYVVVGKAMRLKKFEIYAK